MSTSIFDSLTLHSQIQTPVAQPPQVGCRIAAGGVWTNMKNNEWN